jgi:hypothetical protein
VCACVRRCAYACAQICLVWRLRMRVRWCLRARVFLHVVYSHVRARAIGCAHADAIVCRASSRSAACCAVGVCASICRRRANCPTPSPHTVCQTGRGTVGLTPLRPDNDWTKCFAQPSARNGAGGQGGGVDVGVHAYSPMATLCLRHDNTPHPPTCVFDLCAIE